MYLSLHWLRDYVDVELSPEALSDLLTAAGLEVDGVERTGPGLDGVVVGRVLAAEPHPNADRLRVCTVDLGPELNTPADGVPGGAPVQIVCGAPNVAAGQAVPVATVGTVLMLPDRETGEPTPVKIKKGKIRGEVSRGMICAEDELGLGDDHDGILVLDTDAAPGTPLAEAVDLGGDVVYDIALTPNRPDAASHLGVARDVAALTGAELRPPAVPEAAAGGEAADRVTVEIDDAEGCPRYVAALVTGVAVGPSPDWMRARLEAVGVRSINNVVDVTNYVLHEMGQPLHAFDLAALRGATVRVRASRPGETVTTLDDQERALPEGTLLVCDAERPVAVAGVMGGANSEVSDATADVLIESAYFEPSRVRRAAKALGLSTDASYRFERGVDPTAQVRAAMRAADLLAEVAGGTVVPGVVDAHPAPHEPTVVELRPDRMRALLGAEVPTDEAARLLRSIGFGVEPAEATTLQAFADEALASGRVVQAAQGATGAALRVTVPPFRPDVAREADVIEEVARLWGYDRIPRPATAPVALSPSPDAPTQRLLDRTRRRLAALGVRELYTNSLVAAETAERYADAGWTGHDGAVAATLNPISKDTAVLRPSLLAGMVRAVAYNQARGADAVRFMEAGRVYARAAAESAGGPIAGYHEHDALAVGLSGLAARQRWDAPAREFDIYDLKGLVLDVLADLGVENVSETPRPEPDALTAYAVELSAGGRRLGVLARVADGVGAADGAELRAPLFAAELDWSAVAAVATRDALPVAAPISRFPTVERDLALVLPSAQPVGPLLETARRAGGPLVQRVRLFDLYEGAPLEPGTKSAAIALTFGADRTLRDKEVDGRVRRIVGALEREHGAALRA